MSPRNLIWSSQVVRGLHLLENRFLSNNSLVFKHSLRIQTCSSLFVATPAKKGLYRWTVDGCIFLLFFSFSVNFHTVQLAINFSACMNLLPFFDLTFFNSLPLSISPKTCRYYNFGILIELVPFRQTIDWMEFSIQ